MIVTERRNEQSGRNEFNQFTEHEIILSWLTEELINPYDSESDGAYESFHIERMGQMEEQKKMTMVRDIMAHCTEALSWSEKKLASYYSKDISDSEIAVSTIDKIDFELSVLTLLKNAGLKEEFLLSGQKHTYMGCLFTWLITAPKNRLCELDTVTEFGFSEYFNLDMWHLTYRRHEEILSIMKRVYRKDISTMQFMIYEVNKLHNGFVSIEEIKLILREE